MEFAARTPSAATPRRRALIQVLKTIALGLGVAGWTALFLFGLWMIFRGFELRPGSGDRRCPACWHPLYHSIGRICTECGYVPKHTLDLYPSQLRWDRLALGALATSLAVIPALLLQVADPAKSNVTVEDADWVRLLGRAFVYAAVALAAYWLWRLGRAWVRREHPPAVWTAVAIVACMLLWGWPMAMWPERHDRPWVWLLPDRLERSMKSLYRPAP